ncbi:peptidase domain-containing ABC transporter [Caulobacter sp. BE254]|uniref:peptidase domain-containing ABC transporter n=1 Tax=Caulobacter sp. BE254 TaxID=2817720 RepID=UPI00285ABF07|nr:peptidase domain-containing ABC transporter [Caulobacter sp. BE254]MDR7114666.1 ATP-binding cassette subfamily B protein RaxB [Caulobacter sp. BE254]
MTQRSELNFSGHRRLPVYMASEAAECGLACIAMIARFHGHNVDLNGLRQRFALSIAGTTLRGLMVIADQLSLAPRALRVELSGVRKLRLPAILHWDLNHFVVLKSIGKATVVIHDPARGARSISVDELSNHFTGVALELTPAAKFEKVEARLPVRLSSLWSKMTGFGGGLVQVLALSLALQVAVFAAPFQLQLVVDEAIGRADSDLLTVLALAFGFLLLLQALLEALRAWALQVFGNLLTFQMVGNVVRHLIRLPSSFFEKRHVGDILSRVRSTGAIQDALTRGIVAALLDGVMGTAAAVILFFYSAELALIVVASLILVFAANLAFYAAMRARTEEQLVAGAQEQSHLMETVRGATTIKVMGRETEREASWRNLYASVLNANISVGKLQINLTLIQAILVHAQTVLVIYFGAKLVLSGAGYSVGMLIAFLSFRQTFTDRMQSLIQQGIQFRLLTLHLDRLSDIVTTEADDAEGEASLFEAKGAILLKNVSFSYAPTDPLILQDINLQISVGDFIAITGPSGGGKTTLLKLMLGLNAPSSGEITLEGRAATPALWRSWRRNVGVVAQDDRLLSGTIAENIAFFDPDLDMEKVRSAATSAQVIEDIEYMPMQFMTLVGDMGSSLSGGQRQRILLARALYRDPSVLFLDEGTANLDVETELQIATLIRDLPITRIVVAHRPALINKADRVFTLTVAGLAELTRSSSIEGGFQRHAI